ncbi:MAG: DNA starvation/stationary phase protection protein Dps [Caldilineaceae bacterium]|nr:DNA starvation/stationary phase protection protein Dps [Caldilineaceae bacterium]
MSTKMFNTHNDLAHEVRATIITLLNQQLADTFDLYSQTKQAHWNVKGMNFMQLHLFFDELAEGLLEYVDMIAERVTALGGYPLGTARMAAKDSTLPEFPTNIYQGKEILEVLAQRFGNYASTTRAAIETASEHGDQDTADLFTEVSRAIDKHLWFIDAHLQEA